MIKLRNSVRVCLLILLATLSACSTMPTGSQEQAARAMLYENRQGQLMEAVSWSLQGRLAVRNDRDGGSGSFRWLEQADNSQMDFHGALGRGAWRMLAGALSWWVRGLAAPGEVEQRMLNETGSLAELRQLDWKIEYGRYRSFQGLELPVKMTARRQDVSVKLAVKDWNLSWETDGDD